MRCVSIIILKFARCLKKRDSIVPITSVLRERWDMDDNNNFNSIMYQHSTNSLDCLPKVSSATLATDGSKKSILLLLNTVTPPIFI